MCVLRKLFFIFNKKRANFEINTKIKKYEVSKDLDLTTCYRRK